MAKKPVKKMSDQEKADWDELYAYVRRSIFGYDEKQMLPKYAVLRLKGMVEGKFMANDSRKSMAEYSYKLVLNTFKYSSIEIQRAKQYGSFSDEKHMFYYVMRIIDDNINTVYTRMKKQEEIKKEIETKDTDVPVFKAAEYKPVDKSEQQNEDVFADMW